MSVRNQIENFGKGLLFQYVGISEKAFASYTESNVEVQLQFISTAPVVQDIRHNVKDHHYSKINYLLTRS